MDSFTKIKARTMSGITFSDANEQIEIFHMELFQYATHTTLGMYVLYTDAMYPGRPRDLCILTQCPAADPPGTAAFPARPAAAAAGPAGPAAGCWAGQRAGRPPADRLTETGTAETTSVHRTGQVE